MGIFDRLSTLIRSNINDLINSAEDPEKMLNQLIGDMNGQLVKAKQQVAAAIADEKRLRDQADSEYKQAQLWEERAVFAVNQGNDELAKQALLRQSQHAEHGSEIEHTWASQRGETEKLKQSLRDLAEKIEEAKRKKNLLLARQRRNEAQKRIQATMSSLNEKSAFEAFARMEERIEQNERQLKAVQEIDEEVGGDRLASEFKLLERSAGSGDADTKLLALKAKMGKALPSGAPAASRQLGAGSAAAPASAPALGAGKRAPDAAPNASPNGAPQKHPTEEELLAEFEELERHQG
jgi:phage shock protein A